jgi:hypothetical protein
VAMTFAAAVLTSAAPAAAILVVQRVAFDTSMTGFGRNDAGAAASHGVATIGHRATSRLGAGRLGAGGALAISFPRQPGIRRYRGDHSGIGRLVPAAVAGKVGPVSGIPAVVIAAAGTGGDGFFAITDGRPGLATRYGISAVPEPGVWVMGLFGFAIVGATMRRRPGMATVTA